jgi:hypothetical protein
MGDMGQLYMHHVWNWWAGFTEGTVDIVLGSISPSLPSLLLMAFSYNIINSHRFKWIT